MTNGMIPEPLGARAPESEAPGSTPQGVSVWRGTREWLVAALYRVRVDVTMVKSLRAIFTGLWSQRGGDARARPDRATGAVAAPRKGVHTPVSGSKRGTTVLGARRGGGGLRTQGGKTVTGARGETRSRRARGETGSMALGEICCEEMGDLSARLRAA